MNESKQAMLLADRLQKAINRAGHEWAYRDLLLEAVAAVRASAPQEDGRATLSAPPYPSWYLGSMNDGQFIINKPPRPSNDDQWHDRPDGPTMVLNVTNLPRAKAEAIVEAHNATIRKALRNALSAPPSVALEAGRLDWLQGRVVDTIYLDDGKIIDVRGNSVRDAIDDAMKRWPGSLEDESGDAQQEAALTRPQPGGAVAGTERGIPKSALAATPEEIAAVRDLIASHLDCEADCCQKQPTGCGCALNAARAVLALSRPHHSPIGKAE